MNRLKKGHASRRKDRARDRRRRWARKECAASALRDGANVVLGARRKDELAQAAAELDPGGKRTAHLATDITDADSCAALVELARSGSARSTPSSRWRRSSTPGAACTTSTSTTGGRRSTPTCSAR